MTLERLRAALAGRADVAEKKMVGGRSFMVGGRLALGVVGEDLMIRADDESYVQLLAQANVHVVERTVKPAALETAREIFSTGNYGKVTPCTRYEERELPAGPVARQAREAYLAYTETT